MPTQRYDAPSGKFRKIFVGILSVELDGVCDKKWNTEIVIVFQSVILQHAQGANNSAQIQKRILFRLGLWNCEAFDELVEDTYNSSMGYLGKSCGNQTKEQHHRTFSKLVLKGRLHKAVPFVCDTEKGGVLQPDELSVDCTGMVNKTAALVLEGKYPSEIIPFCATSEMYEGTPIFIPVDITEEAIESVAQKLLGSSGSGGTDSEAL